MNAPEPPPRGRAWRLERDPFGRLALTSADGLRHDGVAPVRAFPIAAPLDGLSIVGADGRELAWVDRLDALPPHERALVEEALAEREFTPEIRRLVAVSSHSTPSTWDVETDRGATRFVLKGEEDIRRLDGGRLLVTSGEGLHFAVPDLQALDAASRRLLERFL